MLFDSGRKRRAYHRSCKGVPVKRLALGLGASLLLAGCSVSTGEKGADESAAVVSAGAGEENSAASVSGGEDGKENSAESVSGAESEIENPTASGQGDEAENSADTVSGEGGEDVSEPETEAGPEEPSGSEVQEAEYIPSAYANLEIQLTPSIGEIALPLFVVDFQDAKYNNAKISQEKMEQWIFADDTGSVAGFYNTSSHGRLHMSGDVYYYTAEGKIADYESFAGLEGLIMECLEAYDDEIDYSQYDRNGDGIMDALFVSVPRGGNADFWWAATHDWYENWEYSIDGVYLMKYIVSDEQPYESEKNYYIGTFKHEMGHCMGLPDYYKYNYVGNDFEGLHGMAGKELMDDSQGDFSQFSKLQLGWLTEGQVQIMPDEAESMTFLLPPAEEGGCVLIFPAGQEPDFQGEYFLVEYVTMEGYYKGVITNSGVRILHAQAELATDDDYYYYYKYYNYSPSYDSSNNGKRVLKMVNDGNGFFHTGDEATFENTGGETGNFGWYTEDGGITAPGFRIWIGEVQAETGAIEIAVSRE